MPRVSPRLPRPRRGRAPRRGRVSLADGRRPGRRSRPSALGRSPSREARRRHANGWRLRSGPAGRRPARGRRCGGTSPSPHRPAPRPAARRAASTGRGRARGRPPPAAPSSPPRPGARGEAHARSRGLRRHSGPVHHQGGQRLDGTDGAAAGLGAQGEGEDVGGAHHSSAPSRSRRRMVPTASSFSSIRSRCCDRRRSTSRMSESGT